jgi:eukaryotic-like serine/threonine-protein kinase
MKDFIDFLKNRVVQKQILFAFIGLFLFVEIVFLALRVYTRHGQALAVPDFSRMSIEEVSKLADLKKLRFVISDSIFIQGQKPGTVVAQNPSPETKVKVNRTIFLTINAFNPEKVKMPNIVGVSFRQAEAIILTNSLRVGARIYVPDIGKDYVLRQKFQGRDIAPGTPILKGSAVDLVLSFGEGSTEVGVPNLKRLTLSKAREAISDLYINLGAIIPDNTIESREDSLKAVIYKQNPAYGSSIKAGNEIDVWITTDLNKADASSSSADSTSN